MSFHDMISFWFYTGDYVLPTQKSLYCHKSAWTGIRYTHDQQLKILLTCLITFIQLICPELNQKIKVFRKNI
jgi:hypothetical protein